MKTVAFLMLLSAPAWGQSLLSGDRSPNDPPKKPSLRKHDHVLIAWAASPDPRDWVRSGALTATVVDVRPNGALVLQAVKRRMVNRDEEVVRITCEVAAANVSGNKTSSEHLANLTMTYDGAGVEGAKPGLLGWVFGKWWPF